MSMGRMHHTASRVQRTAASTLAVVDVLVLDRADNLVLPPVPEGGQWQVLIIRGVNEWRVVLLAVIGRTSG